MRAPSAPESPNGQATNRDPVKPDRRQYPTPTPAPATYNSPTTPAGTGRSRASRTNTAAHRGRTRRPRKTPAPREPGEPIGAPDPAGPAVKGALIAAYTVASVGP